MVTLKKRGQVWIETVTYTLVALVMIGLILSFAKPEIEKMRDNVLIEQSLKMLKEIDQTIIEVGDKVTGNRLELAITLKKGSIEINGSGDLLIFSMESKNLYSEPNQSYFEGDFEILTIEKGKYNKVTIAKNYSGEYDLLYKNENISKIITKASNQYEFLITNKGGDNRQINFDVN